jgi:hypothetical protein
VRLLLDPRIFNFVIMGLYVTNATNYAVRQQWGHAAYWASAFGITASVTFGMK